MSRWTADSRWYRKQKAQLLAGGPTCWWCGHPGSDQLDHLIPASIAPWLRYEPSNWRPTHGTLPCAWCGRHCNQERGTSMTPPPHSPRSRQW